jgi:cbb3-type cytochrome c oxidase subunit III
VRHAIACGWLLLTSVPATVAAQGRTSAPRHHPSAVVERDSLGVPLIQTNEDGQPTRIPPLPQGITLDLVRIGDEVFHGKGHCFACHGADGEGLPNAGSGLTLPLSFVPAQLAAIDSVIMFGIPESVTRSAIAMPPRGGKSDLSTDETLAVAAYVWVISQVRDEPWPGGHRTHINMVPAAALTGTATGKP